MIRVSRLPARVYWFRRLLVLSLVVLLGWGGVSLVIGDETAPSGADEPPGDAVGRPATPSSPGRGDGTSPGIQQGDPGPVQIVSRPVVVTSRLARPTGDCQVGSVVVTPNVRGPVVAGEPVRLELVMSVEPVRLDLVVRITLDGVCRLRLGAGQLLAQVVSPAGVPVWDLADCPREVPVGAVTLRSGWQTAVALTWSGRRRDRSCVSATEPVEPGRYELRTAVVGGEPSSSAFDVGAPRRQPRTEPRRGPRGQT